MKPRSGDVKTILVLSFALMGSMTFGQARGITGAKDAEAAHSLRYKLVHEIVLRWAPFVAEAYGISPSDWAREMGDIFAKSELDALQQAADARTFDGMTRAFTPVAMRAASIGGGSAQGGMYQSRVSVTSPLTSYMCPSHSAVSSIPALAGAPSVEPRRATSM